MFGADWVLLSGLVENKGSSDVEERGFCYSTTNEEPTVADKIVNITTTDFKYKLTSLQPDTRYYVRAYARNHTKVGYGKKVVFKTLTVVGLSLIHICTVRSGNSLPTNATVGSMTFSMNHPKFQSRKGLFRISPSTGNSPFLLFK